MADPRDRQAIAADYRGARDRADAAAMRRYQNEEACFVLLGSRKVRPTASYGASAPIGMRHTPSGLM